MLRKALLLSLLLHLLLLVALAHNFSLPLAPQLPFMLELRVERATGSGDGISAATPPRQEPASPPRQPAQASRMAPAPQHVQPSAASAQPAARAAQPPLPAQTLQQGDAVPPAAVHAGAAVAGLAQAAPAGAATAAANANVAAGETRALRKLSVGRPDYPSLARQLGEEGTVWLRLTVNEQGRVSAVTLLRSSGFTRLDKAAQAAVWQWRFAPQLEAGKAVVAETEQPVRFSLQEIE
ncbi:energy transducer TonB [Vogesella amnigena]|uniref:Protein TonB n=1 Tax=Vogesella amnigena TaxID=1507449 RepID=A0ABV7TS67_9NEIS